MALECGFPDFLVKNPLFSLKSIYKNINKIKKVCEKKWPIDQKVVVGLFYRIYSKFIEQIGMNRL